MLDVDSLFADSIAIDEVMTAPPTSSVFFDSAPTGRASRFRQLFTQDAPTVQPSLHDPDTRPGVDRTQSNPVFTGGVKPSSSSEDREGFQRIMAMLGGGGNKPTMPNVNHPRDNSNDSLWKSHHRCHHLRYRRLTSFKSLRDRMSLRTNSSNVCCGKVTYQGATHHLNCLVPQCQ